MIKKCFLLLGLCAAPLMAFAQTQTTTVTRTEYTTPVVNTPPVHRVELEARYWMPDLDGNVFVNDDGETTDADFKNDLGIDDDHGLPEARLTYHWGPASRFRATYMYIHYKGDNDLNRTITFSGDTYPVATHVESEMKVQYFSLGWLWDIINEEKFSAGVLIDLKGISARSFLNDTTLGINNSQRFTGGAPVPGLTGEFRMLPNLAVFGEIAALPMGHYGHFIDGEGGLKWDIIDNLSLSGGYRVIDIHVNYKDDSGELTMKGPFAALTWRF